MLQFIQAKLEDVFSFRLAGKMGKAFTEFGVGALAVFLIVFLAFFDVSAILKRFAHFAAGFDMDTRRRAVAAHNAVNHFACLRQGAQYHGVADFISGDGR